MLTEGDLAPQIDLPADDGGRFNLRSKKGKPVVVYFYPKDDTSGCTLEAQDFTARIGDFTAAGAAVVGVSPDPADCHARFKAKYGLAVVLAADTDQTAANAYGVWVEKSMYGKRYMGVERATFLVDGKGRLARIWRKVKVPGHADAVLAAVRDLAS